MKIQTNRWIYLSYIRRAVGRRDISTKAYNEVVRKEHALFKGEGNVQLKGTGWELVARL